MLQEITQFIAERSVAWGFGPPGGWIIGTNLFAGHVPVRNAIGVSVSQLTDGRYLAVLENAGGAVLSDVGGVVATKPPSNPTDPNYGCTYFPKYIEKAVQLLNRKDSFFTARQDAEDLYEALHQTAGWNLPPVPPVNRQYQAIIIDAYGPPAPVENPGASGFYTFSTNYVWKIEETSCKEA